MSAVDSHQRRRFDVALAGGVAWTAGAKWVTQLLSFVSVFIATHILSQAEFGLANMAGSFFQLTNTLAEFGVGTAVLQMRELENRILAQLHTFSLGVCALIFVISIPAAPYVASFFHNAQLLPVIIVCNSAFVLTGLLAVPLGLLQKDLDYRRLSLSEAIQGITQAVVLVTCAKLGLGLWSLVVAPFVARIGTCIIVCTWKPVEFAIPRWADLKKPLTMGSQTAVSRLAFGAYTQADGIVVGRVLTASLTGIYQMSMMLAAAPAEKVSSLIMRATGPLFARVQNDLAMARRYFLILTELLMLIELPLMIGLGLVAPDVIPFLLGKGWDGVVWPLRWLVLFMPVRTLGSLMDQVLVSKRQTRFTMTMSLVNFLVMPIAFFVGAKWMGTVGVAAAWFALAPITICPVIWKMLRSIDLTLGAFLGALAPAVSGVAVMAACVMGVQHLSLVGSLPALARGAVGIAVGAIVYAGFELLFFRGRIMRYSQFILSLRKKGGPAALVAD